MNDNLENVAWHLDGLDVMLSASERAMAAEVADDQQALAGALDVHDSRMSAAIAKASRRATAELARPRRLAVRIVAWGSAVAAAAAVVLAITLWHAASTPVDQKDTLAANVTANQPTEPPAANGYVEDPIDKLLDPDAQSLEILNTMASDQDPQTSIDAQLVAVLLES